jgi:hypothetical protein|tara:strand:+ start:134 stop:916 length:783 start_codon:yes stop_codon:yes gene_type:complete
MDEKLIKVKIKDMFPLPHFRSFMGVDIYKHPVFKDTTKSIQTKGFRPEEYGYQKVVYDEGHKKYKVLEGNHRWKIVKELYGEDYEVKVRVVKSMEQVVNNYVHKLVNDFNLKNLLSLIYNTGKELIRKLYTTPIAVILFLTYIVFWEITNLLIATIVLIGTSIIPKDNFITKKITDYLKPDNKIHVVIFNIFKNSRVIVYALLCVWLIYSFIANNWFAFTMLILIFYVIRTILHYLTGETYATLEDAVKGFREKISGIKK